MAQRSSSGIVLVVMLAAMLLLSSSSGGTVQPKKPKPRPEVINDMDRLVPAFRAKVELLLDLMQADGFDPFVWETYRSPTRARELAEEGTGVAQSQHELGLAVDIVDAAKLWNAPAGFTDALERHALALGLGRVDHTNKNTGKKSRDLWHVQALPGKYDAKMRMLASAEKRDAFLRTRYAA